MKKSIFLITLGLFAGIVSLSSCGGGEDEEAKKKKEADSLANVRREDSLRQVHIQDSLKHKMELDSIEAKRLQDSAEHAGFKAGAGSNKGGTKPTIQVIDKGKTGTATGHATTGTTTGTTTGGRVDVQNNSTTGGTRIKVK